MKRPSNLICGVIATTFLATVTQADTDKPVSGSKFTGETLTLLYVTDVRKSVDFYAALGFKVDFYYDYQADEYSLDWSKSYSPEYAEVVQTNIRVGLTTAEETDSFYGGGVRHYFMIEDVDSHFAMLIRNGIAANPNEVEVRPWMKFVTVPDPDNHQIVFGTKNQAYYDRARKRIH